RNLRYPDSGSVAWCCATRTLSPHTVKSGAIAKGREDLKMSDPNCISAANAHYPESILSNIRADFDVEASSRSTHFCRVEERRSKRYPMSLQTTLGLARGATQPPGRNTILRRPSVCCGAGGSARAHIGICASLTTASSKTSA